MVAWWMSLSIAATVMALSGKMASHPLKGWVAGILMERRSERAGIRSEGTLGAA